jgi:hypothetical protein
MLGFAARHDHEYDPGGGGVFKGYYRKRFVELLDDRLADADGLGDEAVAKALRKRRLVVPRALSDYYSVAGRHRINREYNRLYPIGELEWRGDRLVFMEENQWVAFWGIPRSEVARSNPVVWQAPDAEPLEWFAEGYRVSQFLMAMWRWQLTGVQEATEAEPGAASDTGQMWFFREFRHTGRPVQASESFGKGSFCLRFLDRRLLEGWPCRDASF